MPTGADRSVILITGAAGNLGASLGEALGADYHVVGLDRVTGQASFPVLEADLTSDRSTARAFKLFARRYGRRIASVIHLAAYFDFTGEMHPLYEGLNVGGSRRLMKALQAFQVEQVVYSGTILVHEPGRPGEVIDETRPIAPRWAYPQSKAAAEAAIREARGDARLVFLHLAGVYDEAVAPPTLAQQIARIYERDFQSHLYSGDPRVGQSMLHRADMIDAVRRAVERRADLPEEVTVLVGEAEALGYGEVQDLVGRLIHGDAAWTTLQVPKPVAKLGAWAQQSLEPLVPDAIDRGEAPFVRPFMVAMADDHYALDIRHADDLLGWRPAHSLRRELPGMIARLKSDPLAWYEANGVTPPAWLESAADSGLSPEAVRNSAERRYERRHAAGRWAHLANLALGAWLLVQPPLIGLQEPGLAASEALSGLALMGFAALCLARDLWFARWICGAIGFWVLWAPLVFWTGSAAAYLGDTIAGMLIMSFALAVGPEPGVSRTAAATGPTTPPGWNYNPSDWPQRLPIIALALVGLFVSRYLAAYQLGHIEAVWDPVFAGGTAPTNGTEEIITSSVSEAWPVSDAGVGAVTYALEIVTGVIGSRRRWRTMPWMVLLFGLMIAPLGVVSIAFIIIQPIVIGTWCFLCLGAAAAMLIQIPYSLDELAATGQFLLRRRKAGRNLFHVLIAGDTDEGSARWERDAFDRPLGKVVRDMVGGGVALPWNLALAAAIGVWLLFTRLTLGASGGMADADHLIGALVVTTVAIAAAEVARPARFLLMPLGAALLVTPALYQPGLAPTLASLACGGALIALALPRGRILSRFGSGASA